MENTHTTFSVMHEADTKLVDEAATTQKEQTCWWHEKYPGRNWNCLKLVALFALYMILCVCFYTYYEGWHASVALSFVVETMSTVGFGYSKPSDDTSRLVTIVVIIVGIFVVFGGISAAITERLHNFKQKRKLMLSNNGEVFKDLQRRLIINVFVIIASIFVAACILMRLERWTFPCALYFAVQTATSVGYGDIPLNDHGTHIFVETYTFFSTILLAFAISNLSTIYKEKQYLENALLVAERKQTLDRSKVLDTGNGVPRDTFVLAVLEQLGVINHDRDIEPWLQKFAEYDVHNTGVLRKEDIEHLAAEQATSGTDEAQQIRKSMHVGTMEEVSELVSDAIAVGRASLVQVELTSLSGRRSSISATADASTVPNGHDASILENKVAIELKDDVL